MGRSNRQRRADKRRRAAKQQPFRPQTDYTHASGAPLRADQLVTMAALALRDDEADNHAEAIHGLRRLDVTPGGSADIERALITSLEGTIAALWENGWQPADLAHVVGRRLGGESLMLAEAFIAGEARSYCANGVPVEPWWQAQLDELGVAPPEPGERYVAAAGRRAAMAWWATVEAAVALLGEMWSFPPLARLAPPPRAWGRDGSARRPKSVADGIDERILNRVRALLAKAESTEFPEEADALTAKAQELMARHAIDHALLDTGTSTAEPIGRRLGMDDPYADEKAYLLAVIAGANRCQAVMSSKLALPTIIGFPSDLDATELLFTSLLVQGSTALRLLGANAPPGSRQRGTAFRRSFYVGFATRIGERLRAATATAVDDAVRDHGDRLLPVLARRDDAVDNAVNEMFPRVEKKGISASDGAGIYAGRVAADQARLSTGAELEASA